MAAAARMGCCTLLLYGTTGASIPRRVHEPTYLHSVLVTVIDWRGTIHPIQLMAGPGMPDRLR